MHGEADTVTEPEVSRALYERASSKDKTIKLYQGMWHGLTSGEPDANVEVVFSDIISWLNKRAGEEEGEGEAIRTEYNFKPIQGSTTTATNTTVDASSPAKLDPQKPCRKSRSQGKYLCGWRGRRMLHHSSM